MSLPRINKEAQTVSYVTLSSQSMPTLRNSQNNSQKPTDFSLLPDTLSHQIDPYLQEEDLLDIQEQSDESLGALADIGMTQGQPKDRLGEIFVHGHHRSSDSDIESNDLSSLKSDSDLYPKSSETGCTLKHAQCFGRHVVEFLDKAAPVYLFSQLLPTPAPYAVMIGIGSFVLNDRIGEVINAFTTQADPFAGLRADGNGSVCQGLIKQGIKKGTVLTGIFAYGYGMGTLLMNYGDDLNKSDNLFLQSVMILCNRPVFSIPFLGLTGCGLNKLSLAVWNYCWPEQQEILKSNQVNVVQELGQYSMSYFGAYTLDTMVHWHLTVAGVEREAASANMAILMSSYALRESLKYVSYPKPLETKKRLRQAYSIQDMEEDIYTMQQVQPSYRQGFYQLGIRAGVSLFLLGMGYILDTFVTCTQAPGLCEQNTLENRAARDGIALGSVLLADYLVEKVAPKVYRLGYSFFNKQKRKRADDPLLMDFDEDMSKIVRQL